MIFFVLRQSELMTRGFGVPFYRLIPYLKIHVYVARSLTRGWFYCVRAGGHSEHY
jgi:hypothetical protein